MLWIKAIHLIFMVAWFAGLFYLPRLFVYHAEAKDLISHERFVIMERRLYHGIMHPAMILTVGCGLWLVTMSSSYYLHATWFLLKMILIIMLLIFHYYCGYLRKQFVLQKNTRSVKFFRILNEFPTLILIGAVILTVVKPL